MNTAEEIKTMVKEKYSKIALQDKDTNSSSCCGATSCCTDVYNIMADNYTDLKGYNPEADLGLGCGLPTQFAKIKKGDVVIDLGSGAGNDCFIAREETGEAGKVIGIDMTEAMIHRARMNVTKLNLHNVEFRLGEIESMPVRANIADVIISNCVLNLVPDKRKALQEIYRVLKPGGHFSISDIVLVGKLPEKIIQTADLYAGCVSGGIPKEEYMSIIKELGFENITVQKEKAVIVPDDILANYLSSDEIKQYKNSGAGVFSITVNAEKKKDECCDKTTCCK
ncbi:MAG: arsenite methyltransferase [Bacteroidia bacterium]|nr:arsenite methyltransferase [Bacteroidia bacterium]